MKKSFLFVTVLALFCNLSVLAENAVGLDLSLLKAYEDAGVTYMDASGNTISDVISWVGANKGVNYVRIRLFVDPTNSYATALAGGSSYLNQLGGDLATVKVLGKRVKDAGLNFLLDIHYSDGWADPGKQVMPYRWTSTCTTQEKLQDSVFQYTKDVLSVLKAYGATPDMVQVGNEITYGMFFTSYDSPTTQYGSGSNTINYQSTSAGSAGVHCFVTYWNSSTYSGDSYWSNLCNVISKGCQAVREVCPSAKIVLHTERSGYTTKCTASGYTDYYLAQMFYKKMEEHSVDYDVIGLSYYPEDHGTLNSLNTILTALESSFPTKKIMLAEYGYSNNWSRSSNSPSTIGYYRKDNSSYSCPLAQKEFVSALITQLKDHSNVTGMFYWFAEENENGSKGPYGSAWRNSGLWANESTNYASNLTSTAYSQTAGRALPALDVLADFQVEPETPPTYPINFEDGTVGSASSNVSTGWCSGSQVVANNPNKTGINTSNKVMTVTNTWVSGCDLYMWSVMLPEDLTPYDSIYMDIYPTSATSYVTCQFDDGSWTKIYDGTEITNWNANAWNRVGIALSDLSDLTATHMYFGMWESGYSIDNIRLHTKTYTLAWDAAEGELSGDYTNGTTAFGTTIVAPTATRTGYTFAGWTPEVPTTMPAADASYTATWTINSHHLEWDSNFGNDLQGDYTHGDVVYGTPIVHPNEPTRQGYVFDGWNTAVPSTMPDNDLTIRAKWEPSTNTPYTVKHYQQNITDDGYTEYESQTLYGTTDQLTNASARTYTGFASQSVDNMMIEANGSTVVEIYYIRKSHNLVWDVNGGSALTGTYTSGWVRYDSLIIQPNEPTLQGWTFTGWQPEAPTRMPDNDVTLVAQWTESGDTPYTVKHFKQTLQGDYNEQPDDTDNLKGKTGSAVTPAVKSYEGFTAPSTETKNILADGSLVVSYYYTRNKYQLSWNANDGNLGGSFTNGEVLYGDSISVPEPVRYGYDFAGWDPAVVPQIMPAEDLSFTAQWTASEKTYIVKHYKQNLEGNEYTEVEADREEKPGTTGAQTYAQAKSYPGFTVQDFQQKQISGYGTTEICIYYDRIEYTIQFVVEGTSVQTDDLRYGAMPVAPAETPTKEEDEHYTYVFNAWEPEIAEVEDNATYTATFTATPKTPTGIEDVENGINVMKILRNDQIFILRGNKVYTLQGQEVK